MFAKRTPISTIVEGQVYLGDRRGASDLALLRSLGITHVVNCAVEQPNFFPNDLVYYNCNLKDNAKAVLDFEGPLQFIQDALAGGGAVLVHCFLGMSRSASIVIGYVMVAYGMSLGDALQKVEELRPNVKPNRNFLRQLAQLEATLMGQASQSFGEERLQDYPEPQYEQEYEQEYDWEEASHAFSA